MLFFMLFSNQPAKVLLFFGLTKYLCENLYFLWKYSGSQRFLCFSLA